MFTSPATYIVSASELSCFNTGEFCSLTFYREAKDGSGLAAAGIVHGELNRKGAILSRKGNPQHFFQDATVTRQPEGFRASEPAPVEIPAGLYLDDYGTIVPDPAAAGYVQDPSDSDGFLTKPNSTDYCERQDRIRVSKVAVDGPCRPKYFKTVKAAAKYILQEGLTGDGGVSDDGIVRLSDVVASRTGSKCWQNVRGHVLAAARALRDAQDAASDVLPPPPAVITLSDVFPNPAPSPVLPIPIVSSHFQSGFQLRNQNGGNPRTYSPCIWADDDASEIIAQDDRFFLVHLSSRQDGFKEISRSQLNPADQARITWDDDGQEERGDWQSLSAILAARPRYTASIIQDPDWSQNGRASTLTIRNLSTGDIALHVRCADYMDAQSNKDFAQQALASFASDHRAVITEISWL